MIYPQCTKCEKDITEKTAPNRSIWHMKPILAVRVCEDCYQATPTEDQAPE